MLKLFHPKMHMRTIYTRHVFTFQEKNNIYTILEFRHDRISNEEKEKTFKEI